MVGECCRAPAGRPGNAIFTAQSGVMHYTGPARGLSVGWPEGGRMLAENLVDVMLTATDRVAEMRFHGDTIGLIRFRDGALG